MRDHQVGLIISSVPPEVLLLDGVAVLLAPGHVELLVSPGALGGGGGGSPSSSAATSEPAAAVAPGGLVVGHGRGGQGGGGDQTGLQSHVAGRDQGPRYLNARDITCEQQKGGYPLPNLGGRRHSIVSVVLEWAGGIGGEIRTLD